MQGDTELRESAGSTGEIKKTSVSSLSDGTRVLTSIFLELSA